LNDATKKAISQYLSGRGTPDLQIDVTLGFVGELQVLQDWKKCRPTTTATLEDKPSHEDKPTHEDKPVKSKVKQEAKTEVSRPSAPAQPRVQAPAPSHGGGGATTGISGMGF
jgi:hypothetical protein